MRTNGDRVAPKSESKLKLAKFTIRPTGESPGGERLQKLRVFDFRCLNPTLTRDFRFNQFFSMETQGYFITERMRNFFERIAYFGPL